MCRWLAYSGAPIYLEEVIVKPEHSLIDQSLSSHSGATTTNGDGFGIGWYGQREIPGVYKTVRPAWNDANLAALAGQIKSNLFIAHVRATTGTAVEHSNCHPFQFENWIFVHNGAVREFDRIKRELTFAVSPELYPFIHGSTDTEIMFFLALTFGMRDDVQQGVARMVGFIEKVGRDNGVEFPVQMTLGISDGQSVYAFRYSTEGDTRTLYHSIDMAALHEVAPESRRFSADTRAIVSEPLGQHAEGWTLVPESSFLSVSGGEVCCVDFRPETG
jgi:glutamine amidotransferase